MTEATTLYCGETCNHTGPHRYPPVSQPVHVHNFVPFPERRRYEVRLIYCERCGEVRIAESSAAAK